MTAAVKQNGAPPVSGEHDVFPVDSYRDAAKHLRRPFTPAAVKFKPQTILGAGKGVLVVAYIDARLAVERLNLVCPHLWGDEYRAVGDGLMWCDLTVDGITRRDIGEGKGKALVSDALKRAAVRFGVGVSLYAIPQQKLWVSDGTKLLSIWQSGTDQKGKPKYDARLEPSGMAHLRGVYEHWLDNVGRQAFGEPLNHGDVDDHQGDADEAPGVPEGVDPATGEVQPSTPRDVQQTGRSDVPASITAEEADALIGDVRRAGARVRDVKAWLEGIGVAVPGRVSLEGIERAIRSLTDAQAVAFAARLDTPPPPEADGSDLPWAEDTA